MALSIGEPAGEGEFDTNTFALRPASRCVYKTLMIKLCVNENIKKPVSWVY